MKRIGSLFLVAVLAAACASGPDAGDAEAQKAAPQEEAQEAESSASRQEVSPLLQHYVGLSQALAADQLEEARKAASDLAQATQGEIAQLARQAAESADLAAMRQSFIALSEKVIGQEIDLGPYKVAFCPMANDNQGARWVQKDGPIRNPYYGAEMLECGYFPEDSE